VTFGGGLWLALSFWLATAGRDFRHAFPNPIDERRLEYGQSVETHLESEDGDIWTFEGKAGQIVTIAMNSDRFDPYLELYGPHETFLVEDDDSGRRHNAKIKAFQLPASGTYTIIAYSVEDGAHQGSPYSLTLTLLGRGNQAYQHFEVLQSFS
jgi:hypothetical protein